MHLLTRSFFLLCMTFLAIADCPAQLHWKSENPSPTGNQFNSIVYGSGRFVAVGDKGAIAMSVDGIDWEPRESRTDASLRSIIFDGSQFMIVADDGTLLSSATGNEWVSQPSGAAFEPVALGYGNGTYVLLGTLSSTFLVSGDGVSWSPHALPSGCEFDRGANIAFAAGMFVASGQCLMSSSDGTVWTMHVKTGIWSVAYGNGSFVAAGDTGTFEVSVDGSNWTEKVTGSAANMAGVAYGGGQYIGIGSSLGNVVSISSDGVNWDFAPIDYSLNGNSQYESGFTATLKAIVFGSGIFVAVGESGTIVYSQDGVDWNAATHDLPQVLHAIAYGPDGYVAVGDKGTIQTTMDGQTWTTIALSSGDDLRGVAYGDNQYVAVGRNGSVFTSTGGSAWTSHSTGSQATLHAVVFGASGFVAVGSKGAVFTSPDATTWTLQNSGTTHTLRSVAYGAAHYVAAGDSGAVIESTDGATWAVADSGTVANAQFAVAYGNNEFVVVGRPAPKYSTNGVTWHTVPADLVGWEPVPALTFGGGLFMTPNESFATASNTGLDGGGGGYASTQLTIRSIAFGSAGFIGVGNSGIRMLSATGATWTNVHPGAPDANSRLSGIAAGDGAIMAVGADFASPVADDTADLALISSDGETWAPAPLEQHNVLTGVAYHAGAFVASSVAGLALVRQNDQWSSYDIGIGQYLNGVEYVNDRFIALGNGQQIASSFDGISWQPHPIDTLYGQDGVAFGSGTYVVVGNGILASTDLQNWTVAKTTDYVYSGVAFGNGTFVAAGSAGLATSPDGFQWSATCELSVPINRVRFAGGKFVAVGSHAYVSFDGKEWRQTPMHAVDGVHDLAYAGGKFIAVSEYGGILKSDDDLIFSGGYEGVVCPN